MNTASSPSEKSLRNRLWIIATYKLIKGLLLLFVGMGILTLVDKDAAAIVTQWVRVLRFDPENRHINGFLVKVGLMEDQTLKKISAGTFLFAALFFTESAGLFLQRRWAEYLTLIATGMFIPLEIYAFWRHLNPVKLVVVVINLLIVGCLLMVLRQGEKTSAVVALKNKSSTD